MKTEPLSPEVLSQLRKFSTCVVASAIETFGVRLRNTGFADSSVRCIFPELSPLVGYAATARIRSADPPMEGHNYYVRPDWWRHIQTIPQPRVVVVQDVDNRPGLGAFVGEVHANILKALGCDGIVTNGAVRDFRAVQSAGFQVFAGNISVSHAYAHVFDFGGTVEVGGLTIKCGDLIQGDIHGVQSIPADIAARVTTVAGNILQKRQALVKVCRSNDFTLEKLLDEVKRLEF
jgi:4-hydroxy-4-methyl-2-oxoglutarate aldolase